MKAKLFGAFLLTAFLVLASVAFASAANFTLSNTGVILTPTGTVATVAISPANAVADYSSSWSTDVLDVLGNNVNPTVSINDATGVITITANSGVDYSLIDAGDGYTGSLVILDAANASNNRSLSVIYMKTFCEFGAVNDSELELSVDISSDGDEDLEWTPLDVIDIDVSLDNNFDTEDQDYDINDLVFEFGLFDSDGTDVTDDLIWISSDDESFEFGDVDEGDDGEHTFQFKVSPELDEGDYVLFIKAFPSSSEDEMCIDYSSDLDGFYFQEISITKDADDDTLISFDEINIEPATATCGESVTVTAKAYNLGTEKQEAVKVKIFNQNLTSQYLIFENFDNDDEEWVEFTFTVPTNITEGSYTLSLFALHSYDEDDDEDTEDVEFDDAAFDEKTESTKVSLNVKGNCVGSKIMNASIAADFSDETPSAKAGREVIIEATIRNTGNTATNYTVEITGNSAWSTLTSIDPKNFTINAGESKTVSIALDIADDAEGEKEFTIKALYGTSLTEQKVKITVEEGRFSGEAIANHFKNNWLVYVIVLVNLILIIAIIIVIKSILSSKD